VSECGVVVKHSWTVSLSLGMSNRTVCLSGVHGPACALGGRVLAAWVQMDSCWGILLFSVVAGRGPR